MQKWAYMMRCVKYLRQKEQARIQMKIFTFMHESRILQETEKIKTNQAEDYYIQKQTKKVIYILQEFKDYK